MVSNLDTFVTNCTIKMSVYQIYLTEVLNGKGPESLSSIKAYCNLERHLSSLI